MEFQDRSLNCVDCGAEFIWTAGEQLFFADKNFKNEPKRCKGCKAKRASRPSAGGGDGARAGRNHDQLFGVRQRNHGAVPADAGSAGVLPGMFPVAQVRRRGRRVAAASAPRVTRGHARAWPLLSRRGPRHVHADASYGSISDVSTASSVMLPSDTIAHAPGAARASC